MVEFVNLSKSYPLADGRRRTVLKPCSMRFPRRKIIGLIGRNGAGKSTLLRLIAGTQDPDTGFIRRHGNVSWPIGAGGSFHPELTGAQNTRFVARVYGADTDEMLWFCEQFSELGEFFHMPLRSYSSGMKSRLAFAVSMAIPFDIYLIDEVTSVGDQRFKEKCAEVFRTRLQGASAFLVSHSLNQIRNLCHMAAVLNAGRLTLYEDVDEAIDVHKSNMKRVPA